MPAKHDSASSPNADTKTRILDAAETLFIAGGFESMSMRQITSTASVNLAAVNYHFGSKDALIQAVLARRLDPLNADRTACLQAMQLQSEGGLTCEQTLVAMFLPAVRYYQSHPDHADQYLKFLGRAYTDPSPVVSEFITAQYTHTLGRFFTAFQQALPELARHDLAFRLHFIMGALASSLLAGHTQRVAKEFSARSGDQDALVLARLATLMVAALKAPVPGEHETEQYKQIVRMAGCSRAKN